MINAKAIGFTIAFAIVGTLFLITGWSAQEQLKADTNQVAVDPYYNKIY